MVVPVAPREAYVLKDRDSPFFNPVVDTILMEDELLESWKVTSHTLGEWDQMMTALRSSEQTDNKNPKKVTWVTVQDFEEKADRLKQTLLFKTPSKHKNWRKQILPIPQSN